MWENAISPPVSQRPRISAVTTSAEKVENVVSPPSRPVMRNSRASAARRGARKPGDDQPNEIAPIRLAARVPSGIEGNIGLSHSPKPQRSHAPMAAPGDGEEGGHGWRESAEVMRAF